MNDALADYTNAPPWCTGGFTGKDGQTIPR